jgi:hypothetical protein
MADEMLARLDQLQRGARETRPRRQEYEAPSNFGHYDAYTTEPDYYDGDEMYGDENAYPQGTNGTGFIINFTGRITDRMCSYRCDVIPQSLRCASLANAATPANVTSSPSTCLNRSKYGDPTFRRL